MQINSLLRFDSQLPIIAVRKVIYHCVKRVQQTIFENAVVGKITWVAGFLGYFYNVPHLAT